MALQGSGPIWLSQIQAEFGGPNYWMSSYFRGAGYVTNGTGNQGIPTGGTIWFSQFYNAYKTFAGSYDRSSNISSTTVTVPPHSWLRMRVWELVAAVPLWIPTVPLVAYLACLATCKPLAGKGAYRTTVAARVGPVVMAAAVTTATAAAATEPRL